MSAFRKVAEQLAEDWLRVPHLSASDLAERAIELAVEATESFPDVGFTQDGHSYLMPMPPKEAIAARMVELMKDR